MANYSDVDDSNDIDDPNELDDLNDTDDYLDEYSDSEDEKKLILKSSGISNDYCCKHKCLSTFDDEYKSRMKSDLARLDQLTRNVYLFAMISIGAEKKRCGKVIKSSKAFQYAVKEYGVLRYVCKTAFVLLHGTTLSLVRTLCKKMATNHLIPLDNRGRHENRPTITKEIQEQIKIHFFETLHSPNIFKCTKKRLGTPNINQLWFDFTQKYGRLARTTYVKYICSLLTPDILHKFMCANEAKGILNEIKEFNKKRSKKKNELNF